MGPSSSSATTHTAKATAAANCPSLSLTTTHQDVVPARYLPKVQAQRRRAAAPVRLCQVDAPPPEGARQGEGRRYEPHHQDSCRRRAATRRVYGARPARPQGRGPARDHREQEAAARRHLALDSRLEPEHRLKRLDSFKSPNNPKGLHLPT